MGCVDENQWKSQSFWSHRGNISAVMECLEAFAPDEISSKLPALEREGLYFHGLATEIAQNGVKKRREMHNCNE